MDNTICQTQGDYWAAPIVVNVADITGWGLQLWIRDPHNRLLAWAGTVGTLGILATPAPCVGTLVNQAPTTQQFYLTFAALALPVGAASLTIQSYDPLGHRQTASTQTINIKRDPGGC